MKKLNEIEPANWPSNEMNKPAQYSKVLIQTKNNYTYGGGLWQYNEELLIDGNEYC